MSFAFEANMISPYLLDAQQDTPVIIALFDAQDLLQFANQAFRLCFGLKSNEQITWTDLMLKCFVERVGTKIESADIGQWLASAKSRRGKLAFRAFECDMCDGRWFWMTETVRADGWMLCIASDITELQTSARYLRTARDIAIRSALTDHLTGISNRLHMMQQMENLIDHPRAWQRPLGIALVDLDHFKAINDSYGHPAGDIVLTSFARTVHKALRREDAWGRVGGEEFLLLCPGQDARYLEVVATRILTLVRQSRPLPQQCNFGYTCSIGLGTLREDDTASSVYRRVDEALYAAKRKGRDRYAWAA